MKRYIPLIACLVLASILITTFLATSYSQIYSQQPSYYSKTFLATSNIQIYDPQPSYYSKGQIWPVSFDSEGIGYPTTWWGIIPQPIFSRNAVWDLGIGKVVYPESYEGYIFYNGTTTIVRNYTYSRLVNASGWIEGEGKSTIHINEFISDVRNGTWYYKLDATITTTTKVGTYTDSMNREIRTKLPWTKLP